MSVQVMKADGADAPRHFYFACPQCGWCGELRAASVVAEMDGHLHRVAKAKKAAA